MHYFFLFVLRWYRITTKALLYLWKYTWKLSLDRRQRFRFWRACKGCLCSLWKPTASTACRSAKHGLRGCVLVRRSRNNSCCCCRIYSRLLLLFNVLEAEMEAARSLYALWRAAGWLFLLDNINDNSISNGTILWFLLSYFSQATAMTSSSNVF